MDTKVDDYNNVFNVDEIQEGMSAKVYYAFETNELKPNYMMVFVDSGFGDEGKAQIFFNDEN